MGAHWSRDYWHYSDKGTMPPFATKTNIEIDSRAGWTMEIYTVIFHEDLDTNTKTLFVRRWNHERLDSFAHRVWKGGREHGAKLDDYEFNRYFEHLLDILKDGRGPSEREIIYD